MGEDKGEELMEKADKRLKGGFSFFSGTAKFEDAVEMYTKAGNSFKIVKKCTLLQFTYVYYSILYYDYYYITQSSATGNNIIIRIIIFINTYK
jgi:hypothetical protein